MKQLKFSEQTVYNTGGVPHYQLCYSTHDAAVATESPSTTSLHTYGHYLFVPPKDVVMTEGRVPSKLERH